MKYVSARRQNYLDIYINAQSQSERYRKSLFRLLSSSGFTLIELLIVISIIAILTSISVAAYSTFNKTQSYNNARNDLINTLQVARSKASSQYAPSSFCLATDPQLKSYQVKITATQIKLVINCQKTALLGVVPQDYLVSKVPSDVKISPTNFTVTFAVQGIATAINDDGGAAVSDITITGVQTKTIRVETSGRIVVN